MKVVLLGYMGSGKTTIGKLLAKELELHFIDLDAHIKGQEKCEISKIFELKGEIYFRKKEAESLRRILLSESNFVLSIGGGTPCYANNMQVINEMTQHGIYLKVSLPELVERLSKEKLSRPLISNISNKELPEFIGKHLFERSFYYNQADTIINCEGKGVLGIVEELKTLLCE